MKEKKSIYSFIFNFKDNLLSPFENCILYKHKDDTPKVDILFYGKHSQINIDIYFGYRIFEIVKNKQYDIAALWCYVKTIDTFPKSFYLDGFSRLRVEDELYSAQKRALGQLEKIELKNKVENL